MNDERPYVRWARYYDRLHAFIDYEAESRQIVALVRRFHADAGSLLDVACGTGRHLACFRNSFDVAGLDANVAFLDIAATRVPGVPLHHADMTGFGLGRTFDAVTCLFSSIAFVRTVERLEATLRGFREHLARHGVLVFVPWFSRDNFWTGRVNAQFVDDPELKIAWIYTTSASGGLSTLANTFVVGTPAAVETIQEDHVLGLFSPEEYRGALERTGFDVLLSLDPCSEWPRGVHVARRAD